jgi:hypothetical protein
MALKNCSSSKVIAPFTGQELVDSVRVLRRGCFLLVSSTGDEKSMLHVQGGENQIGNSNQLTDYSKKARTRGAQSYLEPNIQSMQKKLEGVHRMGGFRCQWHVENAL